MLTPILAKVQNSGEIPRGNLTLTSRQNQIRIRFKRAKIKYFLAEVQISGEIPRGDLTLHLSKIYDFFNHCPFHFTQDHNC